MSHSRFYICLLFTSLLVRDLPVIGCGGVSFVEYASFLIVVSNLSSYLIALYLHNHFTCAVTVCDTPIKYIGKLNLNTLLSRLMNKIEESVQ